MKLKHLKILHLSMLIFSIGLFGSNITILADNGTLKTGPPSKIPVQQVYPKNTLISLSPLMQFKSGIPVQNVQCNQSFELVIKAEDGSPACVRPNTAIKLVERAWALTGISVDELKKTYNMGRAIDLTIRYAGLEQTCQHIHVIVLDSNHNTVWESKESKADCIMNPNFTPYVIEIYTLSSLRGGPIVINKAGNYTVQISLYGSTLEKKFMIN
ncbi:MAG: hypothetical protein ACREA3_10075 [Nitrosotalea sp.]